MDAMMQMQVLRRAAETLSIMRIPQFWGLDRGQVADVFASAFVTDPFNPDPHFIARLAAAVSEQSGGTVTLREAATDELERMAPLIKGPAGYLVISGEDNSLGVVMVPAYPPLLGRQ